MAMPLLLILFKLRGAFGGAMEPILSLIVALLVLGGYLLISNGDKK
jgi:hypothetical protein